MGNLCHFLVVWPWEIISFLWGYFIYWGVWGGISPLEGSAENFICKSLWKYLAKCLPHHQGSRRVRYYHPWFCLSGSSVLVKGLSLFLIQQVPNKAIDGVCVYTSISWSSVQVMEATYSCLSFIPLPVMCLGSLCLLLLRVLLQHLTPAISIR